MTEISQEEDLGDEDCRGIYGCFPRGYPWKSSNRPISLKPLEIIEPVICLYDSLSLSSSSCLVIVYNFVLHCYKYCYIL